MKSAGLKNITARHISMAAQSIGAIAQLIPHIKEILSSKCTDGQTVLLAEFDRLLKDYNEHQQELYSKLVSIMSERVQSHIANLKVIDWNAPLVNINEPSVPMSMLVKETGRTYSKLIH